MAPTTSPDERASDQLLWLAGAVLVAVALGWLLLARPWSDSGATGRALTTVDALAAPARTSGSALSPVAPAEPRLEDTLRLARLAQDAGMLLEPAGYGAWDLYGGLLAEASDHPDITEGLARVADALVERGYTALQQGRADDAQALANLIRQRLPAHPGALELARALELRAIAAADAAPTPPTARATLGPERRSDTPVEPPNPVPALLADFERALAEDRLLAPAAASARTLLARLSEIAPAHADTHAARERLFERYIALAQAATEVLDRQAADTWIDEAAALGIHADRVAAARAALTARLVAVESNRLVAASDLTLLHYVPPEYPARAVARGIEGWVDVEFVVDTEGGTGNIVVTGASHESLFHEAALAAVAEWRFAPRSYLGQPIPQRSFTRIRFAFE